MNNKVYIASHSIPGKVIILDGMTDTIIKEINVGNRPLCFDK
jgi:DNA-binding beta-propeller fold protein YncE